MGCGNERTVEGKKSSNGGYPVCRLTVPLTIEVDAIAPLNNEKLVLGAKNLLQQYLQSIKVVLIV